MRPVVFALPLLAAGFVFAQSPSPQNQKPASSPQPAQMQLGPPPVTFSGTCPVGMSAREQGGGQTLWTMNDFAGSGADTGVHVDLWAWKDEARQGSPIRQVELSVNYLAAGLHMMLVNTAKPGEDLHKTYHLAASDGGSLHLAGDLLVGPTSGITRVTLLRIDYANGTSWRASNRNACSIAPKGVKLVGAQ